MGWDETMNWTLFFQMIIIGLATGSLIALIALGYTLVYGIVELINFAHGEVFMMGAFLTASILGWVGVSNESPYIQIIGVILLAMVASMIFCGVLNSVGRILGGRIGFGPRQ